MTYILSLCYKSLIFMRLCVYLLCDVKTNFVFYPILQSEWWITVHSLVSRSYKKQVYDKTGFNMYKWEANSNNSEGTDNSVFRVAET